MNPQLYRSLHIIPWFTVRENNITYLNLKNPASCWDTAMRCKFFLGLSDPIVS
jgi:hypothetical protein